MMRIPSSSQSMIRKHVLTTVVNRPTNTTCTAAVATVSFASADERAACTETYDPRATTSRASFASSNSLQSMPLHGFYQSPLVPPPFPPPERFAQRGSDDAARAPKLRPEPSPGGWDDGTSSDDDDAATMKGSAKGGKAKAKGEPAGKAHAGAEG